jgi:N-acyl homoserine lactone hydrolase
MVLNRNFAGICLLVQLFMLSACSLTSHTVSIAEIGKPSSSADMESLLSTPGSVSLETIVSIEWHSPLAGLVNLKSPAAVKAGLVDKQEPIEVYLHVLKHPIKGNFFIDSGASEKVLADPASNGVSWLVRQFMAIDQMKLKRSTASVIAGLPNAKVNGVFLTHMHLDHIAGMLDIPNDVPIYTGSTEGTAKSLIHAAVQGTTDSMFKGKSKLQEWKFSADPQGRFDSIVDVFGDGSVFVLSVPGHTPGSVALLVRTTQGPVLFTGDSSHTRWGWDNGVEPGSFTEDGPRNLQNLLRLKDLVKRHPNIDVRLGHQR